MSTNTHMDPADRDHLFETLEPLIRKCVREELARRKESNCDTQPPDHSAGIKTRSGHVIPRDPETGILVYRLDVVRRNA